MKFALTLVLSTLLLICCTARAAEPASKPAAGEKAKADLTTPKSAMKSLMTGIMEGDADAAKKASIADAEQTKFLDQITSATSSFKKLEDAAIAKFGDAGKDVAPFSKREKQLEALDAATESITDDTATVTMKDQPNSVHLKKVDGNWKVDLAQMPELAMMKSALPMLLQMKTFTDEFAADLKADKYATAEAAKTGLQERMQAFMMEQMKAKQGGAASQPAPAKATPAPETK